jgi:hypothetical protein
MVPNPEQFLYVPPHTWTKPITEELFWTGRSRRENMLELDIEIIIFLVFILTIRVRGNVTFVFFGKPDERGGVLRGRLRLDDSTERTSGQKKVPMWEIGTGGGSLPRKDLVD